MNRLNKIWTMLWITSLKLYIWVPFSIAWLAGRVWAFGRITKEAAVEGFRSGNAIEVKQ